MNSLALRDKIALAEDFMRKLPQLSMPVRHFFIPGACARELTIPADTLLTGRIHKYPQINILSKGDITVSTDDEMVRIQAPFTLVSPPGTKRIAYTHTECVWTTINVTDETDETKVEDVLTVATEEEYQLFVEGQKCLT